MSPHKEGPRWECSMCSSENDLVNRWNSSSLSWQIVYRLESLRFLEQDESKSWNWLSHGVNTSARHRKESTDIYPTEVKWYRLGTCYEYRKYSDTKGKFREVVVTQRAANYTGVSEFHRSDWLGSSFCLRWMAPKLGVLTWYSWPLSLYLQSL